MPDIENFLHYRSIDVSSVKELCRRWYPEVLAAVPPKREAHRALDDIRESIAELAYYRSTIFIGGINPDSRDSRSFDLPHPCGDRDGRGASGCTPPANRQAQHHHRRADEERRRDECMVGTDHERRAVLQAPTPQRRPRAAVPNTETSTASPKAPPSCCITLTSPDAAPASS